MSDQKGKTKRQLGKQPPRYRFFFNPYADLRCTNCPQCGNKMRQRKLPLVIHLEPMFMMSLNKTCRYCPHCDLLIAHRNDVEALLKVFSANQQREFAREDYLVVGTIDREVWKRGVQQAPLTLEEMLENLHDFKEVVIFEPMRGWG